MFLLFSVLKNNFFIIGRFKNVRQSARLQHILYAPLMGIPASETVTFYYRPKGWGKSVFEVLSVTATRRKFNREHYKSAEIQCLRII